jgi:glucose/arabinose dehydrogenase
LVSYAVNYNGVLTPSPDSRPDLAKPVLYWTPIIAPGNLIFYDGKMFPQWKGSALVSGLASRTLIRIVITGENAKGRSAGTSATAFVTSRWGPTARSGCSETAVPAGCSA